MRSRQQKQAIRQEVPQSSRERWALIQAAEKHAKKHPTEFLTITAIELNPWNAVYQGALDLHVARAAFAAATRLAEESSAAWTAHELNDDGFAADAANDAARGWQEYVDAHGHDPIGAIALGQ